MYPTNSEYVTKFGELDPFAYYDSNGDRFLFFSDKELNLYLLNLEIKNLINFRN